GFNGINIENGAYIDPVYSFTNCVFQDFINPVSSSSMLTIDNNQALTITGAAFPDNTSAAFNVAKNVNQGQITFVDYTGSFSGEVFENDPYNRIDWFVPGFDLNLRAFLEGPFKTIEMSTDLNPVLIPLNQPFNTAPWNYAGSESVTSIPNANVVDWVLVELRDATSAAGAGSSTRLARQAAFLLKDGSVVGTDGSSPLSFANSVSNSLFVVTWHRNHLGIISANPLTESGGVYSYDFTTNVNKAYQSGQKNVNGKAVMFGGDVNANGTVNTADKNIWSGVAGTKGYVPSDMDMDSQVDNKDKNDIWTGNLNEQSKVPN
ncbi:MAG: hypothetical protein GXO89_13180, partial [Chlorobi bacterium]|nr:hypothetical protein [Chlorobiota bacterium]